MSPVAPGAPEQQPSLTWPSDDALAAALGPWLARRRWCPLSGVSLEGPGAVRVATSTALTPLVRDLVVSVPRGSGEGAGEPLLLHVPLVLDAPGALATYAADREDPDAVGLLVGTPGGGAALVDGAHHPAFWRAWAESAYRAGTVLGTGGAVAIAQRAHRLRVTTGEQSNTSVVMPAPRTEEEVAGDTDAATGDLVVKVLRVLSPGPSPDVEVPLALARSGWERVRRPVAWTTLPVPAPGGGTQDADAAVASVYVPDADDGFELFCSLASQDAGPGSPARGRAVELARALGLTTAQMHAHLTRALRPAPAGSPADLAQRLRDHLEEVLTEVPSLAQEVPGLRERARALHDAVAALGPLPAAIRVHGDYHLGQVILAHPTAVANERWYVLDFEGEPLRPLAERRRHDQPLRDVAGMLRSLGYAAAVGGATDPGWLQDVREAFLAGVAVGPAGLGAGEQLLLTALELDKALYEVVYESRHRPHWSSVPREGVRALLASTQGD